jgi:hypothetical protein
MLSCACLVPPAVSYDEGSAALRSEGSASAALAALLNPPAKPAKKTAKPAGGSSPARRFPFVWGVQHLHDSALSLGGGKGKGARRRGGGGGGKARARLFGRRSHEAAEPEPFPSPAGKKLRPRCLITGEEIPDMGVDGIFDVLHLLGEGGSASTYLCRDLATSELVAVKFMQRPLPKLAVPLLLVRSFAAA